MWEDAFQRWPRKGQEGSIEASMAREPGVALGEGMAKAEACSGKKLELSRRKQGGQRGGRPMDKGGRGAHRLERWAEECVGTVGGASTSW